MNSDVKCSRFEIILNANTDAMVFG